MLPPSCVSKPALAHRCAISAVVVDLPLVPVMATNGAWGACARRSRQNSSMSPITSTAMARASPTDQCGRRMGQRHARRQHQRRDLRPVKFAQIGDRNAGARRIGDAFRTVIPADDVGTAGEQRARRDKPRAAEPEHRDLAAGKCGDRDHACTLPCEGEGRTAEGSPGWGGSGAASATPNFLRRCHPHPAATRPTSPLQGEV